MQAYLLSAITKQFIEIWAYDNTNFFILNINQVKRNTSHTII